MDNNITFKKLSTFTLDVFLIAINFIYKSLFNHQPFDGSSIINALKLFAKKKRNISLVDNAVTMKYKLNIVEEE